nr:molybdopterin-binding protein [Deferrisoma camini]
MAPCLPACSQTSQLSFSTSVPAPGPEATRDVIDREVPGMAEAMRWASLQKTPHAMISRAVVGIRGAVLVVNLPGSPKAARENLEVLLPALPHAMEKIQGDPSECAQGD